MKKIILTLLNAAIIFTASAQETQVVCQESTKTYSIENPTEDSEYIWTISPENAGKITKDKNINGKISVEWKKSGTLSVYEQNSAGCEGEPSTIKISFSPAYSAQFNNASVCYGEDLQIEFSKNAIAPFEVTYTLDGVEKKLKEIKNLKYVMENISGNYELLKVTDANGCEFLPEENKKAIIGKELKKLIIKKEE